MSAKDWDAMFKDEGFVRNYKVAEKATGPFGEALIEQSGIVAEAKANPEKPLVVLDNACGTGIISRMLHDKLDAHSKSQLKLTCGDISEAMIEYTRREAQKGEWSHVDLKIVDAQNNGLPSDHFTHVFTAFAFMALPKSLAAIDDTMRIIQPGGTIAFTTWIKTAWVTLVGSAVATIPGNYPWPTVEEFLDLIGDGKWYSVSWVESQLQERGFRDINVKPVTKSVTMKVSELSVMLNMMVPMIAKHLWSEQQQKDGLDKVIPAIKKYLEEKFGADEPLTDDWTALVATARKA